jgi:hypothetical protein
VPVDSGSGKIGGRTESVYGVNRPFFHVDVATAVKAAVESAKRKEAEA